MARVVMLPQATDARARCRAAAGDDENDATPAPVAVAQADRLIKTNI